MSAEAIRRGLFVAVFGMAGWIGCAEPEDGRVVFRVVQVDDFERAGPGLQAAYRTFRERRPNREFVHILELVGVLDFAEGDVVRMPLPGGEAALLRIHQVTCGSYSWRPATCLWSARTDDHAITMSFGYRRNRLGGLVYDTDVGGTIHHFRNAYRIETVDSYQFMYRTRAEPPRPADE